MVFSSYNISPPSGIVFKSYISKCVYKNITAIRNTYFKYSVIFIVIFQAYDGYKINIRINAK